MLNLALDPELPTTQDDLGEVFTRRWVVDLILDLVGYTDDVDLASRVIIEPSCGEGAFLGAIVGRLLSSLARHGRSTDELEGAIAAFDLSDLNAERARKLVLARLLDVGIDVRRAEDLVRSWVRSGDFLVGEDVPSADFVVGNPPYIRLENVPASRTAAYRAACPTMRGRSDVYVGFIERGLRVLRAGGALGFIVADRWMHNQYGADLRKLVGGSYSVDVVVEMHDADAFEDDVSAYPAVTVIRHTPQGKAVLATATSDFDARESEFLRKWVTNGRSPRAERRGYRAERLAGWFPGDELWPSGEPAALALVSDLERRFGPLEDACTGTRVGIGLASGADDVYVTTDTTLVEEDRLLPMVMAADIGSGSVSWSGKYLVNPWHSDGLIDLTRAPLLAAYLRQHEDRLRSRHVAKRRPHAWYRTIDRVAPDLLAEPKLLLPDIKAASHPVLEEGRYYPHHNLYFVVSRQWDLEVLGGLLLSEVANLFVGAYCVKMRGGCYRFQAQYIRKMRTPHPSTVGRREARALTAAFAARDVEAATAAAVKVYGIEPLPDWT